MSVRTVTLSEDAYVALAARKRGGESFSEVVRRLARTERSLKEFIGACEKVPEARLARYAEWIDHSDRTSRTEMLRLGRRRCGARNGKAGLNVPNRSLASRPIRGGSP